MNMTDPDKLRLVWVKWRDSRCINSKWRWMKELSKDEIENEFNVVFIETVGWLVCSEGSRWILSHSITSECDKDDDRLVALSITIPFENIIEWSEIK